MRLIQAAWNGLPRGVGSPPSCVRGKRPLEPHQPQPCWSGLAEAGWPSQSPIWYKYLLGGIVPLQPFCQQGLQLLGAHALVEFPLPSPSGHRTSSWSSFPNSPTPLPLGAATGALEAADVEPEGCTPCPAACPELHWCHIPTQTLQVHHQKLCMAPALPCCPSSRYWDGITEFLAGLGGKGGPVPSSAAGRDTLHRPSWNSPMRRLNLPELPQEASIPQGGASNMTHHMLPSPPTTPAPTHSAAPTVPEVAPAPGAPTWVGTVLHQGPVSVPPPAPSLAPHPGEGGCSPLCLPHC